MSTGSLPSSLFRQTLPNAVGDDRESVTRRHSGAHEESGRAHHLLAARGAVIWLRAKASRIASSR